MASAAPATSLADSPGPGASLKALAADIKLSHSLFALPFALLAAFMARPAGGAWSRFAGQMALIVVCMVSARTFAMLANRIIDRDIDALNPRTSGRALPSGRVALRHARMALLWSAGVFIVCCVAFGFVFDNWWPTVLSIPVLAWIGSYGWMKRWTWMCHVFLGSSLAISPLAAALAIEPAALAAQPALWLLSLNVLCWVAGFDVVYALQDVQVDRQQRLHSLPSRLGVGPALWISRLLHAISAGSLTAIVVIDPRFGSLFAIGVAVVVVLLIVEHAVTAGGATGRIQLAFFTLNGVISCLVGALGIASVVMH
ncbi:MAG: UbiA family prenyltransferase [Phycisphaerales bacterium]|nr:UbiA family prenyltransferase [Phycisphaerales bacterium]